MDVSKTHSYGDDEERDRRRIYLESGLAIDDPTQVPGLLARVERDMTPISALEYNTKPTIGRKVDCAACGHARNHHKGFLLAFEDGGRAMVGIECGERDFFYEGAWGRLRSQLEQRKRAALFKARRAPVVRDLAATRAEIVAWRDTAKPLANFLADFRYSFRELTSALVASAKRDGRLARTVMRTVPVANIRGDIVERTVPTEETVVVLPCPEAFAGNFPQQQFHALVAGIDGAAAVIGNEDAPQPKLAATYASLRRLRGDLIELHAAYDRARRLADPGLWDSIAKWGRANPERIGNYRRSGKRFRHSDADRDFGEVYLLEPAEVPAVPLDRLAARWPNL